MKEDGVAVLTREGRFWTVRCGDGLFRVRHVKGLDYIARLLESPGRDIPATELAGLHGPPGDPDRARVRVTKAIQTAEQKLGEHDPALAELLAATVRTGRSCVYRPLEHASIIWKVARIDP